MVLMAMDAADDPCDFDDFVRRVEPNLRRALVARYGTDRGRDATAEALAYAWEHRDRVVALTNPEGFLFRVAQSRSRRRRQALMRWWGSPSDEYAFEPKLNLALRDLSPRQRVATVLCHGYGWTHQEVADLLGVSKSSVQVHLSRGLAALERAIGEVDE